MSAQTQAPLVSLALPGTWADLPLHDDEALKQRVSALVKQRVGRDDRRAMLRREVREQLMGSAQRARESGAFALHMALELVPGVPFAATLLLALERWPGPSGGEAPLEDRMRATFQGMELIPYREGWAVGRSRTVERQLVEERIQEFQADYWLAREDAPDALVRIHVNAPNAPYPELYDEFFTALIRSASWRRPGDIGMPDDIDARETGAIAER